MTKTTRKAGQWKVTQKDSDIDWSQQMRTLKINAIGMFQQMEEKMRQTDEKMENFTKNWEV